LVLHGLMGMLDNWQSPAKALAADFQVFIVDQRNHGHSPHHPELNYAAMAEDLEQLIEALGFDEVLLLGHSMGGKTVMKFAQNNPDMVEKLVVADIAPKAYPVHHDKILEGLSAIDLTVVNSRKTADEILQQYIPEIGVRQFLLKGLYWAEKGKLAWRFNLEAIKNNIEVIGDAVEDRLFEKPTLFVRGEKSDYIQDEDWEDIQTIFPDAELATIPQAGHWVHAEAPQPFLKTVVLFLKA